MKFSKSVLLILLFSALFANRALSQKAISGYVILSNNDTVKCEFKSPLNSLKYRPLNSTGKYAKITTDDVKEFYDTQDSTIYEAILPGRGLPDAIFLKRLEQGAMNLYEENDSWSINQNSIIPGKITFWYVSKTNKPLTELKSGNVFYDSSRNSRRNSFADMIADDPELLEKFKGEKNFDLKMLRGYVRSYNIFKAAQAVR